METVADRGAREKRDVVARFIAEFCLLGGFLFLMLPLWRISLAAEHVAEGGRADAHVSVPGLTFGGRPEITLQIPGTPHRETRHIGALAMAVGGLSQLAALVGFLFTRRRPNARRTATALGVVAITLLLVFEWQLHRFITDWDQDAQGSLVLSREALFYVPFSFLVCAVVAMMYRLLPYRA